MDIELPQTVRIGPYDYEVNPQGARVSRRNFGEHDFTNLEILVDTAVAPMQIADSYLHEILHGLFRDANLHDVEEDLEERIVSGLATSLLSFMRDNPNGLDPVWEAIGTCRRADLAEKLKAPRGTFA